MFLWSELVISKLIYIYIYIYLKFLLEDNCFTVLFWFLSYSNVNQSQGYTYPPPLEPPSHLPPHLTSLACHRAPGLSFLCHIANSHWLSILYTVMYMFPCYSLNLSRLLLPSLCPEVCSLCLCLLCCPANRFISTIFLDPIHMHPNIFNENFPT